MEFRGLVWKRVQKITSFRLKSGQDLENRAAHPHQEFPGVSPKPTTRQWEIQNSIFRRPVYCFFPTFKGSKHSFSSPEPVVFWSRGLSLQIKPSGSGDENGVKLCRLLGVSGRFGLPRVNVWRKFKGNWFWFELARGLELSGVNCTFKTYWGVEWEMCKDERLDVVLQSAETFYANTQKNGNILRLPDGKELKLKWNSWKEWLMGW